MLCYVHNVLLLYDQLYSVTEQTMEGHKNIELWIIEPYMGGRFLGSDMMLFLVFQV